MGKNKSLIVLLLLLFSTGISLAQNSFIRGSITDSKGKAIPFASVQLKGSGKGTAADEKGNFSIEAPVGGTLIISATSYESQEILIGSAESLSIGLKDANSLKEVVVTALGIK